MNTQKTPIWSATLKPTLKGEATLYIGENRTPVKMEPNKLFNVTAGTWHNIVCSEDASVLIAENSDTDKSNTEYFYL